MVWGPSRKAGEPIGEMKEFAERRARLRRRDRLAMRGRIADVLDEARLDGKRPADERLKARLRQIGGEIGLIRNLRLFSRR